MTGRNSQTWKKECCDSSSLQLKHRHTLLPQERCPLRFLAEEHSSLILQVCVPVTVRQREVEKRDGCESKQQACSLEGRGIILVQGTTRKGFGSSSTRSHSMQQHSENQHPACLQ